MTDIHRNRRLVEVGDETFEGLDLDFPQAEGLERARGEKATEAGHRSDGGEQGQMSERSVLRSARLEEGWEMELGELGLWDGKGEGTTSEQGSGDEVSGSESRRAVRHSYSYSDKALTQNEMRS